jgi:ketosteroid isomerase-like protein
VINRREAIVASFAALTTSTILSTAARAETSENPDVAPIQKLLKAHDEAFANQNLDGVMECLATNAVIMGTGPREVWSGPNEIKVAYGHFFKGFDKGEQHFEYQFRFGGLSREMGWLMTSGNVTGKKKGQDLAFPLNLSLVVSKLADQWKISAMHFSTLAGASTSSED